MKKIFIGHFNLANLITFLGLVMALCSISFIGRRHFEEAMICFIVSGLCDLFDGMVARKLKRTDEQKKYGIQLDSLVDVVSFLIVPAAFLLETMNGFPPTIAIVSFFVICGVTRLAWFNITTDGNTKHYQGLPVTFTAIIIPLAYLILNFILNKQMISSDLYFTIFHFIYGFVSVLFVLNFKVKKLKGAWWYILCSILAVATIVGLFLI